MRARLTIRINPIAGALILLLVCRAQAADSAWYTSASFSCSDPFTLHDTYMNGTWFHKYLDLHFIHVSHATGYVELNKTEFDEMTAVRPQPVSLESYQLTSQNAQLLRKNLLATSTDSVVPVTAGIMTLLLNYAATPGKYVGGGFLKYLLSSDAAVKANARGLSEVMAEGGHVNRLLTVGIDSGSHHQYLLETFDYSVDVAMEHRHYSTASCTYPIKLMYRELVTQSTSNNKIFRRISSGRWDRIDIDTNRTEQVLFETARDDNFLYLNENDPQNRINDAYRIDLNGGPWQTKGEDGIWRTLCSKVIAR